MLRSLLDGLLDLVAPPRCVGCDDPLEAGGRGFCAACAPLVEPDPTGRGAYLYGGPMADAIRRFKYAGRSELSGPLGQMLAAASLRYAGAVDLVVPVPLHARRLAQRGFDQASLLARPVARALGVRASCALRRVRATRAQAGLDAASRAVNVRAAFACSPVRGRALLVDDVLTTGATAAACAATLLRAGADSVETLVLARAEG